MTKRHLGVDDVANGILNTYCGIKVSIRDNERKSEWNLCIECVKVDIQKLGPRDKWLYKQRFERDMQHGQMKNAQKLRGGVIQGPVPGSDAYGYKWPLYEDAKHCVWCGGGFIHKHDRWKATVEHVVPQAKWNKSKRKNMANNKLTASHAICNQRRGTKISWGPAHVSAQYAPESA